MFTEQFENSFPVIADDNHIRELRRRLHQELIENIENESSDFAQDPQLLKQRIKKLFNRYRKTHDSEEQQLLDKISNEIIQEINGLGPLAPLMMQKDVNDILVNAADDIWVERNGQLEKTDICFDDEPHLRRLLDRIIANQGKSLDVNSPMVDARLNDGSRLHAVIPPLCNKGAIISIRRFHKNALNEAELLKQGVLNHAMLELLKMAVKSGINIVIAGGSAAGKTSLLNFLSGYIAKNERIITVEETAELQLQHPHVIPLESRLSNLEGKGEINLRTLVRTALRMRADRIMVGEVRGEEVYDMLQAMNTGHDGSMTTLHANSAQDVLQRLETLALLSSSNTPLPSIQRMIGSAIQLIVQLTRFHDGSRRIVSITEVTHQNGQLSSHQLFSFNLDEVTRAGKINGQHVFTSKPINLLKTINAKGYSTEQLAKYLSTTPGGATHV